jgi:hypothetical protein
MFMARGHSKGRLRRVKLVGLVLLVVFASGAVASCEQAADEDSSDASVDAAIPHCKTNEDCATGESCAFPILVGCSAVGDCLPFEPDAMGCVMATSACGCDGKTVQIPACWMGFAPAPVFNDDATACEAPETDAH